jgi:hypothetical protein
LDIRSLLKTLQSKEREQRKGSHIEHKGATNLLHRNEEMINEDNGKKNRKTAARHVANIIA